MEKANRFFSCPGTECVWEGTGRKQIEETGSEVTEEGLCALFKSLNFILQGRVVGSGWEKL